MKTENKKFMNVFIEAETKNKLEELSTRNRRSLSAQVELILKNFVDNAPTIRTVNNNVKKITKLLEDKQNE